MKNIFLLSIVVTLISCQKTIDYNTVKIRENIIYASNSRTPFTGLVESYYDNNQLQFSMHVTNGLKDGVFKEFFKNGALKKHSVYSKGERNGISNEYFETGEPKIVSIYKSGMLDGTCSTYWYPGLLSSVTPYENGKKNGLQRNYSNGNVLYEVHYVNDIPVGDIITYDTSGKGKVFKLKK